MSRYKHCEQCGFGFYAQDPHVRFCSPECRQQGWIEEQVRAASQRVEEARRPSRDGYGVRVYLTTEEIHLLRWLCDDFHNAPGIPEIDAKFADAARRAEAKRRDSGLKRKTPRG